eukprot:14301606-Ditylum_brightwellii.AAC.2
MNRQLEQRTYAEHSAERNNRQGQRANTDPASFQYNHDQEPHSPYSNQGAHVRGHDSYSSEHQSSLAAIGARSDVPQSMAYAPVAYRYPESIPSSDRGMASSGHGHPYYNYASGWQQYNETMRPYNIPPHHQQYPENCHVSLYRDYHSHLGGSNHGQMAHFRDTHSMQPPQIYSPHGAHTNHGNFPREHHGGNHFMQDPFNPAHVILLATDEDKNWLSEFLCFVRLHCIETFCASQHDVSSRLGSKKVKLGQVGIRCRFCAHSPARRRVRRSSTFPSSLSRIYQSLTMMLRDHFLNCSYMPKEEKEAYIMLRSNTSQGIVGSKDYWVSSAKGLGLIDTPDGIYFDDGRHAAGTP